MKNETLDYLVKLHKSKLSDAELEEFISFLSEETKKINRKESLEYLLRVVELTPDQIINLLKKDLIKNSIYLQYPIKKYISVRHYQAAEAKSENESPWMTALLLLGTI